MSERKKLRVDCVQMSKCGLTSRSRCLKRKARLKECEDCKLVRRIYTKWKMIDRKPHKKCNGCGEYLPLDKFYMRKVKRNGKVYEYPESKCRMCRKKETYLKKWGL